MATLTRYLLFQVPGWILLCTVLLALRAWRDLPLWIAVAVVTAWLVKDLLLFPLVKDSYDPKPAPTPTERLIGKRGIAAQDLAPEGYVKVRGELWAAVLQEEHAFLARGEAVRVSGVDRMRLRIEPDR